VLDRRARQPFSSPIGAGCIAAAVVLWLVIPSEGAAIRSCHYREIIGHSPTRTEPRLPQLQLPLFKAFEKTFAQNLMLLDPTLPPSPDSDWSRLHLLIDNTICAHSPLNGGLLWQAPLPSPVSPKLLLATPERVILATRFGISALDAGNGQLVWSLGSTPDVALGPESDPEDFPSLQAHAYAGGRLLSIRDDGRAATVDIHTGAPVWQRELPFSDVRHLSMTDRRTVCVTGEGAGQRLRIVSSLSGELLRTFTWPETSTVTRLHMTPDDRLLAASTRSFRCYDLTSGALLWSRQLPDLILDASLAFDLDGFYASDDGSHVKKYSYQDGRTLWKSGALGPRQHQGLRTFLRAGELVTLSDLGLTRIDPPTGDILWRYANLPLHRFRKVLSTAAHIVVIGASSPDRRGDYGAYFFSVLDNALSSSNAGILEMGTFEDVRTVTLRDGALILQTGRTILGWTGAQPSKPVDTPRPVDGPGGGSMPTTSPTEPPP